MATDTSTNTTENGRASLEAARFALAARLQQTCDRLARANLEYRLAELDLALAALRTADQDSSPLHP